MEPELVDEGTGEVKSVAAVQAEVVDQGALIPVRESSLEQGGGLQVAPDYKPTTLLDYSALMLAARAHPRDVNLAIKQATAICTMDEETAKEVFYALPIGGKKVTGESIGMAETLAACYGNMNITIDDIRVDREEGVVIIRGFIMDCETGLTYSTIIRRSIRNGPDHKYNPNEIFPENLIERTSQAAVAITYRSLVLRIVPRPIRKSIYHAALNVAMGDATTFKQRQAKCVQHWESEMGVPKAKLLLFLGYTEMADMNVQDFEFLLGLENAIKTGDTTIDAIFKKEFIVPTKPGEKPETLDQVSAELKARAVTEAKEATTAALASSASFPPETEETEETPAPEPEAPQETPPAPPQAETPAPFPELPPETPQEPESTPETPTEAPPAPASKPEPTTEVKPAPGAPIKRPPGGPPVRKKPMP